MQENGIMAGKGRGMRGPLTVAALVLLAACSRGGKDKVRPLPPPVTGPPPEATTPKAPPPAVAAQPTPTPGLSPQQRYALAIQLLVQGRTPEARVELTQVLAERPGDRRATLLIRSIDTDPQTLLGANSFAYTVRQGDTLFSLARTYLKDGLNFYALARYNKLTLPVELQPGQTVLIPGRPRAPERTPGPRRPPPTSAGQTAPGAVPPPPTTAGPPVRRDEAQRLRAQGLAQMSAGSIDRAVTLLSQAASLDPENRAIAGDLARARRIQATVRSR